jgi:hypothetical protein
MGKQETSTEARWQCRGCNSVCEGEKEFKPTPCDFCGSEDIVEVPLETPLRPPDKPYDNPENWVSGPDVD